MTDLKISQNSLATQEAPTNQIKNTNNIKSSEELKVSTVFHEISTPSLQNPTQERLKGRIDKKTNDDELPIVEKIGSTATVIVSEHKRRLDEIKAMDNDDLMNAYDDPNFSDYIQDIENEILERMEKGYDLIENDSQLVQQESQQIDDQSQQKQELSKIKKEEIEIKQTQNTEATEIEEIATEKATEIEEIGEQKASEIEKNALVMTQEGELQSPNKTTGPIKGIVSLDQKTGILSVSKENLKYFKVGKEVLIDGVTPVRITKIIELTEEEAEKLYIYVTTNFHPEITKSKEEDKETNKENFTTNIKYKESGTDSLISDIQKSNQTQMPTDKLNVAEVQSSKSSFEKDSERLKACYERALRLQEKIKKDIEIEEILSNNFKRNDLFKNIEKLNIKLEKYNQENIELENEFRQLWLSIKQKNSEFSIDMQTRPKFKETYVIIKDNKNNISRLRKQIMTISQEVVNPSGNKKTKGTDTEGKTET